MISNLILTPLITSLIICLGLISNPVLALGTMCENSYNWADCTPTANYQENLMASAKLLSPAELNQAISELKGWSIENNKLHNRYQFPSFVEAFGFMTSLALVAESMGHHPEWFNVYNRVTIDLTTHDAGGITNLDVDLAKKANELAGQE